MFRLAIALMGVSALSPFGYRVPTSDFAELTFKARLTGTMVAHCERRK
jgi:hypothetical protein